MDRTRFAVLAASAASFAAGIGLGALASGRAIPPATEGPSPDYERRFVRAFDPTPEQVSALRFLLLRKREREEEIRNRSSEKVEPQLRMLGAEVEESVREDILTPAQRIVYDDMVARGTGPGRP